MQKIATILGQFLHLRPNCLLTRKPIRIESSTSVRVLKLVHRLKQPFYRWQIARHGYKIAKPNDQKVHLIDMQKIPFSLLLNHLISCAEKDYLEGT